MQTQETLHDLVRANWSRELTDEECSTILWELTAFPFIPVEEIAEQVKAIYAESGGNIGIALNLNEIKIDVQIEQLKRDHPLEDWFN